MNAIIIRECDGHSPVQTGTFIFVIHDKDRYSLCSDFHAIRRVFVKMASEQPGGSANLEGEYDACAA